jgi:hypothetical protein
MKANSKNYKGIEYVQVSDLPLAQQEKLLQTINHDLFIKIMIDRQIISNCLQYKDYVLWFDKVYKAEASTTNEQALTVTSLSLSKA